MRFGRPCQSISNIKSISNMETIIENYGLCHIAINMFDQLDYKSLCKARMVSKSWKDFIDNFCIRKRNEWKLTSFLKSKKWFLNQWPEWKNILKDFVQNRSSEDVKLLLEALDYYYGSYCHIMNLYDPLMIAIEIKNDLSLVKLIAPSVRNLSYQNKNGRTPLHKAVTYGRVEIVKWLLDNHHQKIDFGIKDKYGTTTLEEAKIQCQWSIGGGFDRETILKRLFAMESSQTE